MSGDNAFKEFHCREDRELGKTWRRQWGQECFYNMGGITSVFINGNYHVEKKINNARVEGLWKIFP